MNHSRNLGGGHVLADHAGMKAYSVGKVRVVQQIMRLSYATLSQAFDGVIGKPMLDGIRFAMIEDLAAWPGPVYSWREVAARVKGASEHEMLH